MNVCVVGWYYTESFYDTLRPFHDHGSVFVIQHRPDVDNICFGLSYDLYPNEGLEFGAYDQYLKNHWDGDADVLFIQDDTLVTLGDSFIQISKLADHGIQMAYIFNSEYEEIAMAGIHGRGIYCSSEFLKNLRDRGGFPYDPNNHGTINGGSENAGIQAFARRAALIGNMNIGTVAIIPGIQHGRRGVLNSQPYFFDRKSRDSCTILTQGTAQPMISSLRK